jgi:NADP-dependent 3-hydroxy acid dehydrogenase YdfG
MTQTLRDKIAIVTGASSGIGAAAADMMAPSSSRSHGAPTGLRPW